MKCSAKVLVGLLIAAGTMGSTSSLYAGSLDGFIGGAANAMQQMARDAMILELEKQAIEHRMKLEEESRQRQREYDERRRQEASRRQQEEDARQKELARKKAEEERRLAISTGTGFFVASNGYLVTNNHVIDDTTDFAVRDFKGRFYRAQLIARDPKRDLALLKVSGNFPVLRIAHSDTVSKGQHVFAVGYPQIAIQGNESKVTDGIISSFSGIRNDDDWFQISVPIQGGNSGGPLVTEGGSVVGVVVASVNVSKFYAKAGTLPQNVNYAIKSKLVLDFLKDQGVKIISNAPAKVGLGHVDSATAMVIAKNGPIDVAYAVSPEQTALDERARKQKADEDSRRRKAEELAEKREQARIAADTAQQKREEAIEDKRRKAEELAAEKKQQHEERIALKRLHLENRNNEVRNLAVRKEFPEWPEIRKSALFDAWLLEQTDNPSDKLSSAKPNDVIQVLRRFSAEREQFAAILLERDRKKTAAAEAETKATVKKNQDIAEAASSVYVGKIIEVNKRHGFVVAQVNRKISSVERLRIKKNEQEIWLRPEKQVGERLSLTLEGVDVSEALIGSLIYVRH